MALEINGAHFCKVQFYADDKKWAIFGKVKFQKLAIRNKISEKMDRCTTNMILCADDYYAINYA